MEFTRKNKSKKKGNLSPKVVYISSPMKVKTTASRFRSLVQQLTGRDSDITRFMDIVDNNNSTAMATATASPSASASATTDFDILPQNNSKLSKSAIRNDANHFLQYFPPMDLTWDSPTSSESLIEQSLGGEPYLDPGVEDQYLQDVFSSSFLFEYS